MRRIGEKYGRRRGRRRERREEKGEEKRFINLKQGRERCDLNARVKRPCVLCVVSTNMRKKQAAEAVAFLRERTRSRGRQRQQ